MFFILALKVILLDRLQGIICSIIQEPYLLGVMLWCSGAIAARASHIRPLFAVCVWAEGLLLGLGLCLHLPQGAPACLGSDNA